MRKGIDSLCGIINNEFKQNPLLGDLFIFLNRRKNQIKMLHFQGDGFAVFYKRLEKGTYELPSQSSGFITNEQLLFLLQGLVLKSVRKHSRYSHANCE